MWFERHQTWKRRRKRANGGRVQDEQVYSCGQEWILHNFSFLFSLHTSQCISIYARFALQCVCPSRVLHIAETCTLCNFGMVHLTQTQSIREAKTTAERVSERERPADEAKKKLHIITAMDGYFWVQDGYYIEPESSNFFCLQRCVLFLFVRLNLVRSYFCGFVFVLKNLFLKMPMHKRSERKKKKFFFGSSLSIHGAFVVVQAIKMVFDEKRVGQMSDYDLIPNVLLVEMNFRKLVMY